VAIVNCKRWKVARTGVEPLSELHAAKDAHNAHECIFVAAGEISDNARAFAVRHRIGIVGGPELAPAHAQVAGRTFGHRRCPGEKRLKVR
jgi:restriction system protein